MRSAFTPDCGYDNSTFFLIGDVYCPNTKCLGRLCLHKKTFEFLGRSDYQCPQCWSVFQVRNIPYEEQTISFFLSLGQGVYVFEESPQSIQEVIRDVYCPGEFYLNRQKCESIGGYVTTPRKVVESVELGCLFTKFLLSYKSAYRRQKQTKHAFSLLKKMLADKQFLLIVPFQSTKYGKKELCVDNMKTIGDVYCPMCRNEKCVYISTNKTTSFYDCKKCKACCNVLNIPRDEKPTNILFGGDGTHCFAKKTGRDYEIEEPSPFSKKFLRQSHSSTSEPEPKKFKVSPNME